MSEAVATAKCKVRKGVAEWTVIIRHEGRTAKATGLNFKATYTAAQNALRLMKSMAAEAAQATGG